MSEIARNFGILAGGAFGLYLAWNRMRAANLQAEAQARQAELTRRDHVAELFNRAVGQLKDDKLEIRFGAIITLGQICRDFGDLSAPAVQWLATYLRENRVDYGDGNPPVDISMIVDILRDVRS